MSNSPHNISHEEIVELQEKFREIKVTINNFLAVMMALSEMSQRGPGYSEKLASTVLTKAPQIVSRLQEFTQALNEKAPRAPQIVSSLQEFTQALNEKAPQSISSRVRLSLTRLARRCTAGQSQKIEKEITITNRLGLDAVPAAMFVRIASRFRSEIWVEKEGEQINGKSILGLMMLAAGQGSKLHIRCEGPDTDRAMQELEELIKNRFNEDCSAAANFLKNSQALKKAGPKPEVVELQEKFSEIKHAINNALAVMMALSEMSRRRPGYFEKLASTVLTKAPQIVSSLQEFTQALNETAGPELQKKFSEIKLAIINADILKVHPVKDQQSPVIARLKKGQRVILLEEEQDWAKVEWLNEVEWLNDTAGGGPQTGWVASVYLGKLCFPRTPHKEHTSRTTSPVGGVLGRHFRRIFGLGGGEEK
jgi:phosphocarrier protein